MPSTHVMIRMPNDLLTQIDAYAATLEAQIGISDVSISRALAIRELCKKGLQSLAAVPPASQPQTLQPSTTPEPAAPPAPAAEAPAQPVPEKTQDGKAVIQEKTPRRPGRQGTLRQPILDLLRERPGLTAVQMKVYLQVEKNIGDTLSGMVRDHVIEKQGSGTPVRYRAVAVAPQRRQRPASTGTGQRQGG